MLFALVTFITLLIAGLVMDELRWSHVGLCLLFAAGALALFAMFHWQPNLYVAVLAVMDIVLILIIFKGNIGIR